MNEPLVSIIMPTYNRAHIIQRAINSVVNQEFKNWELIIIDDGSADNTKELIGNIYADSRIKVIGYPVNKGQSYARNQGLNNVHGEYIAFLDSDNQWNSNFLSNRLFEIEKRKVFFSFGRYKVMTDDGNYLINPLFRESLLNNKDFLYKTILRGNIIDINTLLLKADIAKDIRFDESMRGVEDWDFILAVLSSNIYSYAFIDDMNVNYYFQKDSVSFDVEKNNNAHWIIYKKFIDKYIEYGIEKEKVKEVRARLSKNFGKDSADKMICEFNRTKGLIVDLGDDKENVQKKQSNSKFWEKWNEINEENMDKLIQYFLNNNYKGICIYGYGNIGQKLYRLMEKSPIAVSEIVDKQYDVGKYLGVPMNEVFSGKKVDAVIISAINYEDEIRTILGRNSKSNVISIKSIVEEL